MKLKSEVNREDIGLTIAAVIIMGIFCIGIYLFITESKLMIMTMLESVWFIAKFFIFFVILVYLYYLISYDLPNMYDKYKNKEKYAKLKEQKIERDKIFQKFSDDIYEIINRPSLNRKEIANKREDLIDTYHSLENKVNKLKEQYNGGYINQRFLKGEILEALLILSPELLVLTENNERKVLIGVRKHNVTYGFRYKGELSNSSKKILKIL